MVKDALELYQQHFVDRDHERLDLWKALAEKYSIRNAIYPGSFAHITPSFVFAEVVYIDSDKRAKQFFESDALADFVARHKIYDEQCTFRFHAQSYTESIPEEEQSF